MNKPPVNGLGAELRSGIADALERANGNAAVKAIVLTGTSRAFSGGADVTEFGTPKAAREPNLRVVISLLENSPKPVVAARLLDTLAALSRQTNFAVGCYCEDEQRCHRSIPRELLAERGADLA